MLIKLTEGNKYNLNEVVEFHTASVLERQLPHVLQHKTDHHYSTVTLICTRSTSEQDF